MKTKLSTGYAIAIGGAVLVAAYFIMRKPAAVVQQPGQAVSNSPTITQPVTSISSSGISAADSISVGVQAPTLQFGNFSTL